MKKIIFVISSMLIFVACKKESSVENVSENVSAEIKTSVVVRESFAYEAYGRTATKLIVLKNGEGLKIFDPTAEVSLLRTGDTISYKMGSGRWQSSCDIVDVRLKID